MDVDWDGDSLEVRRTFGVGRFLGRQVGRRALAVGAGAVVADVAVTGAVLVALAAVPTTAVVVVVVVELVDDVVVVVVVVMVVVVIAVHVAGVDGSADVMRRPTDAHGRKGICAEKISSIVLDVDKTGAGSNPLRKHVETSV